jgi:hypothetical protein
MGLKFCQEFSARGIRLFEQNLENAKILIYVCNGLLLYKNEKTTLQEVIFNSPFLFMNIRTSHLYALPAVSIGSFCP